MTDSISPLPDTHRRDVPVCEINPSLPCGECRSCLIRVTEKLRKRFLPHRSEGEPERCGRPIIRKNHRVGTCALPFGHDTPNSPVSSPCRPSLPTDPTDRGKECGQVMESRLRGALYCTKPKSHWRAADIVERAHSNGVSMWPAYEDRDGGPIVESSPSPSPVVHDRLEDAESLARRFHEAYERLAPRFGYETRFGELPWSELPENNRKLMAATCAEVLSTLQTAPTRDLT